MSPNVKYTYFFFQMHDLQILLQIFCLWTLSIVLFLSKILLCLYSKTQHFGDRILSTSSGKM
jgi:hypothetical protein